MKSKGVFCILFVSLIAMLAFVPISVAFATPPEFQIIPIDITYTDTTTCGFPILFHLEGTMKVSTHFDQNGNFIMEVQTFPNEIIVLTNLVTGKSLSSPQPSSVKITPISTRVTGLTGRIVLPGQGVVFLDAGRVVYDNATGNVIFEAGTHDIVHNNVEAFCSALADP